ncbi:hypothetical protein HRG_004238 [Hirsutella rhossiliensis]|uniref:Uncharacterized protein n=1 Tax=Hirsutella rhossiliensis TaxID=111463 RepID=A0A9P8MYX4_9HYPO|nr:uncharacterized protein HRG_04238 [Hirsutella rhossiliensis]KAH0963810.1 hypothetical protein HRG_04238 [Hirsutella rhossiliensis]
MTSYATLFAEYGKSINEDKAQLDDLVNRITDADTYREHMDPFHATTYNLGTQVSGALGFLEDKQRLTTQEPDPYRRDQVEKEEDAEGRALVALQEGQAVVAQVYGGIKLQVDTFVGGMLDNFIVINKIRSKVRGYIDAEDEDGSGMQNADQEADGILVAIQDALWELSPAAPFKDWYNKITSDEEVGVWGWLGVTFEIGLEVLAWVPTPAAPAARIFKIGRTAYKVMKLLKKAQRIITRSKKLCKSVKAIGQLETAVATLQSLLQKFTMGLNLAGFIDEQESKPREPTEAEKKTLLELNQLANLVKVPKRGRLNDDEIKQVLSTLQEKLKEGDVVKDAMKATICKRYDLKLLSLVGGGGGRLCGPGRTTPSSSPNKKPALPNKNPTSPEKKKTSPKIDEKKKTSPKMDEKKKQDAGRWLLTGTSKRADEKQQLVDDVLALSKRSTDNQGEMDLDRTISILDRAAQDLTKLDKGDGPGKRDEDDDVDGLSFLDNEELLQGFAALFKPSFNYDPEDEIDDASNPELNEVDSNDPAKDGDLPKANEPEKAEEPEKTGPPSWFGGSPEAWTNYIDPSDVDCDPSGRDPSDCDDWKLDPKELKTWGELGWTKNKPPK